MNNQAPRTCRIPASGITLAYVSRGSGPLVIFLHGFPDTYRGFLPILDRVAAAGYRAVALAMRGYAPSALAPGGDYRIQALAGDVIGLADALGAERFTVVGHDWGAVTAYAAAHLAPQRVTRLVTAAVPHTGHFLLRMRWQQLRRSSYMLRFQLPWFPEWEIPRDDYRWLDQLIARWSPGWACGDTELRPLKQNFDEPGRLKAALSYYRQLGTGLLSPASRRLVFPAVTVPTRMIYGGQDGCIAPAMFQGQQRHFTAGLDLVAMPDAGHFMQWEQAGRFADLVVGFLM